MAKSANAGKLRIKQVRSIIGYDKKQGQVVRGLGLRKIRRHSNDKHHRCKQRNKPVHEISP